MRASRLSVVRARRPVTTLSPASGEEQRSHQNGARAGRDAAPTTASGKASGGTVTLSPIDAAVTSPVTAAVAASPAVAGRVVASTYVLLHVNGTTL